MRTLSNDRTFTQLVVWITTFFIVTFHIGAIAALFFFTWKAFFVAMFFWWVASGLGFGMRYHRLLTHRDYKTPKWVEYVLTTCGTLALQGGTIFFVAIHRMRHQNTDKEGDPHSLQDGGLWSHVGWILTGQSIHNDSAVLVPCVPDLRKDKFHVWISRWHWVPMTVFGGILLALCGWPFLFWCIFLRAVLNLDSTWLINSATDMCGSPRYQTAGTYRNSFWVALLTFGEGWHNNHHAPNSVHGLGSYEFGSNWYGICALWL
jgi:fatty-acid desaturase